MEPATQGVPGYFVWEVPGQPVAIHLRLDVVERMAVDIMRGFGAVPKRGAEVGGILVGVITPGNQPGDVSTVRIEDFEAVPCRYVRGPSYLLTEPERTLFAEVCQRQSSKGAGHPYPVGYYRSHTREGLALQPEDLELLDRHFSSRSQVALLVKPFATKPGVAGFFVRENDAFPAATPLEFPFRRWEMTGEEPPRRLTLQESQQKQRDRKAASAQREESPAAKPAPPLSERIFSAEPEPPKEPPQQQKSRTGMWMVAAFVFLLLGVLLGYEASRITAPRRPSDFALSLAVERAGENLAVRWNQNAPAVRSASNGVLEIDEGGETKRLDLDRANLSSGSMIYHNASEKVHFRLVVYLASGLSVIEELQWPR